MAEHTVLHVSDPTYGDLQFDADLAGPLDAEHRVLLLHGWPQGRQAWHEVAARLAEQGVGSCAIDQRGYSPGARPDEIPAYAIKYLVADAVGVLDAMQWRKAHIVGHDWGAIAAWQLAGSHPERAITLTALSVPHPRAMRAALANDEEQQTMSAYMQFFRSGEGPAEKALLDEGAANLRRVYGFDVPEELVDSYVARLSEPGALTASLRWYRAMHLRDGPGLESIVVPTTFVWGHEDVAVGSVAAYGCEQWVQGPYAFVPLEDRGHWLPEQDPATVAGAILDRIGVEVS